MPAPTSLPTNVSSGGTTTGHKTHTDTVHGAVNALTTIPQSTKTADYTLALGDSGECVEANLSTAIVFTVPPNSSVAFPVGTTVELCRLGTGSLTVAAGAGVTLRTPSSLTARAQYSSMSLRKRATDEWVVAGDLT